MRKYIHLCYLNESIIIIIIRNSILLLLLIILRYYFFCKIRGSQVFSEQYITLKCPHICLILEKFWNFGKTETRGILRTSIVVLMLYFGVLEQLISLVLGYYYRFRQYKTLSVL